MCGFSNRLLCTSGADVRVTALAACCWVWARRRPARFWPSAARSKCGVISATAPTGSMRWTWLDCSTRAGRATQAVRFTDVPAGPGGGPGGGTARLLRSGVARGGWPVRRDSIIQLQIQRMREVAQRCLVIRAERLIAYGQSRQGRQVKTPRDQAQYGSRIVRSVIDEPPARERRDHESRDARSRTNE